MPRDPLADLLAYSGHELRTPLTSLTLAVEMCADGMLGPLSPLQAETLAGAAADCARLRRLIDALTDPVLAGDLARVERVAVDVGAALGTAIAVTNDLAVEREVTVAPQAQTAAPTWRGDADRTARLLAHGLGHALARAQRASTVTVAVTDSGGQATVVLAWQSPPGAAQGMMELWLCERLATALGGAVIASADRLEIQLG